MKYLWVPHAQLGSICPAVPYINGVRRAGHQVAVLNNAAVSEIAPALPSGIFVIPRISNGQDNGRLAPIGRRTPQALLRRITDEVAATEHAIETWKPDVVISDPLVPGAAFAAERQQRPWVSYVPWMMDESQGLDPHIAYYWADDHPPQDRFKAQWHWLRREMGLEPYTSTNGDPRWWNTSPYCTLLLTYPLIRQRPRALPAPVHIAAPVPWDPLNVTTGELPFAQDRPNVLVTTSTKWQDDLDVAVTADRACQRLGVNALATVVADHDTHELTHPIGLRSHSEMLPHVDAVVGVGGMGVTMKAIHFGVPQIISPQGRDTRYVAACIERYRLGEVLSPHPLNTNMETAIHHVLSNPSPYRTAAQLIRRSLDRRTITPDTFPHLIEQSIVACPAPQLG